MKLGKEVIVTLKVLRQKGESNADIARRLGVSEDTVRYPLRRQQAADGRVKLSRIESLGLTEVVDHWIKDQQARLAADRNPNIHSLWLMLGDAGRSARLRRFVQECLQVRSRTLPGRPRTTVSAHRNAAGGAGAKRLDGTEGQASMP